MTELRRKGAALGLGWAADGDRERLDIALHRAEELERMRVEDIKRHAGRLRVQPGDKPRKKDWLTAVLRAEFPAKPLPSAGPTDHRRIGRPLLQWSGTAGMMVIALAMVLTPLGVWRLSRAGQAGLQAGGTWARQTAETLRKGSDGLDSASAALESSSQALRSVGTSLDEAQPLLTSIGDVLGNQAPDAISTARQSLINAESGAQSIDRVLRSLSFLGIGYNPDQPLAQALADTAESLAPLPTGLSDASDHLATTQTDIQHVSRDVVQVSDDLASMATQIAPVAEDLGRQADQLDELAASIELSAQRLPIWIWAGVVLVELLLLNGAITQYAVWTVGRREDSGSLRRSVDEGVALRT